MKTYNENITIIKNAGEYMMVYVQARSLHKKVLHWVKDNNGKWTPFEIEWIEWFNEISRPVKNYPTNNPGIELRCRMKRKGKFTDDEWKLINEHCKMVEWR